MKKTDLVIVTWHQTYLSSYAGGYVRLQHFLKRIPKKLEYVILDNHKSIYGDVVKEDRIIEYQSPNWINSLQKKVFILWFLLETISSTIILYNNSIALIKNNKVKVLYFPTGEFLQLYIVSFLLKKKFPHVNVVLDILNYGILDANYKTYFGRLKKSGIGLIRAMVITITIWFSHTLMKHTITHADYIFTVSREFRNKIKKDYKKESINFTPSGVEMPNHQSLNKKPKYLGLYIGRMTLEKGIYDVIATWEKVIIKVPTAQLALGGYADDVTKAAIRREIHDRRLDNNVIFLGDVTEEKKHELLHSSELFIHLAHKEPLFPVITILEGWSYGLPTIFYNMSVYNSAEKEFNFSKVCLYPIKGQDISNASNAIVSYSKLTRSKKEKMQESARKNAELFSWDIIAKKEWDIITSLVQKS
ncbi:MAG: glycosyltransferase [Candidatus Levybacteria bacterium]|nr:glycosyltransferase [Candidatus Levybacteria bacterium]